MINFRFDPTMDIARRSDGLIYSTKPEMVEAIKDYYKLRSEDSKDVRTTNRHPKPPPKSFQSKPSSGGIVNKPAVPRKLSIAQKQRQIVESEDYDYDGGGYADPTPADSSYPDNHLQPPIPYPTDENPYNQCDDTQNPYEHQQHPHHHHGHHHGSGHCSTGHDHHGHHIGAHVDNSHYGHQNEPTDYSNCHPHHTSHHGGHEHNHHHSGVVQDYSNSTSYYGGHESHHSSGTHDYSTSHVGGHHDTTTYDHSSHYSGGGHDYGSGGGHYDSGGGGGYTDNFSTNAYW
eukprot:NODE_4552_length_1150_cov_44.866602_g4034_i0.p1 GENE.NODE_4552_length_1150_cov_44.866602_g4034_i0~~NODE_4552_length_1150_cov_44.866602_g4034_i0.p1  ORF type:complete len:332 (+),score=72.24 NODE_4552_length_1150_cov_44.866602_g4034_i0:137-997(+)